MKEIIQKLMQSTEFRFLCIGGLNTLIGYLVSVGIYELFGENLHIVLIGIINAVLTISISFYGHRNFVFRSEGAWFKEYLKMYFVNAVSMTANIILIWLAVDVLLLPFWFSQGVITFVLTIYMYFAHKYFTFK